MNEKRKQESSLGVMEYFYARVSTEQQNEARQIDAAKSVGISDGNIFLDKESGKNFDRANWIKLTRRVRRGDVLYVKSLDRIGRNYKETIEQWQTLVKNKGVDIVVLDMPLLDTRRSKDLLGTFISDVVLQILSFVAENERRRIRERAQEGIAAAKARGVVFGRKKKPIPEGFEELARYYLEGKISGKSAAESLGMAHTTFVYAAKKLGKKTKICYNPASGRPKRVLPEGFEQIARQWLSGEASAKECAERFNMSAAWFRELALNFGQKTVRAKSSRIRNRPKIAEREEFRSIADRWFRREINGATARRLSNVNNVAFRELTRLIYGEGSMRPKYSETFIETAESWERGEKTLRESANRMFMSRNGFKIKALKYFKDRDRGELQEVFK